VSDTTFFIDYKDTITQIQATNIEGSLFMPIAEFSPLFSEVKAPLRVLELAGLKLTFLNNEVIVEETHPAKITKLEFEYLSKLVQAEADGEDDIGKILVVNVIMNRLHSNCRDFGRVNTIKDVINQPNQFQPMRNGAFKRAIVSESTKDAVNRALNGEDYSNGATFFRRARDKHGTWHMNALNHLFTHGGHAFFKPH